MAWVWILLLFSPTVQAQESRITEKYIFNSFPATWKSAERFCNCFGGHLIRVTTAKEVGTLRQNISQIYGSSAGDHWTGLFAINPPNQDFAWSDCCKGGQLDIWGPDEPDNPETEHCIRLSYFDTTIRTKQCDILFPFVCETDGCTWTVGCQTIFLASKTTTDVGKVTLQECIDFCNKMTSSCLGIAYSPSACLVEDVARGSLSPQVTEGTGLVTIIKTCNENYVRVHKDVNPDSTLDPSAECGRTYQSCSASSPTTKLTLTENAVRTICKSEGTLTVQDRSPSGSNTADRVGAIYDACVSPPATSSSLTDSSSSVVRSSVPNNLPVSMDGLALPGVQSTASSDQNPIISGTFSPSATTQDYIQQTITTESIVHLTTPAVAGKEGLHGSTTESLFDVTSPPIPGKEGLHGSTTESLFDVTTPAVAGDESLQSTRVVTPSSLVQETSSVTTEVTVVSQDKDVLPASAEHNATSTTSSSQAVEAYTGSKGNDCGCFCFAANNSLADAYFNAELLKRLLLLDKEKLSRWRRLLTSAPDPRPSARACGAGGLAFLAVCGIILLVLDATRLCCMKKRQVHSYKTFKHSKTN